MIGWEINPPLFHKIEHYVGVVNSKLTTESTTTFWICNRILEPLIYGVNPSAKNGHKFDVQSYSAEVSSVLVKICCNQKATLWIQVHQNLLLSFVIWFHLLTYWICYPTSIPIYSWIRRNPTSILEKLLLILILLNRWYSR